jgi:hypothetical protein
MPGVNPIGIPNENFVEESAATATAPPTNFLRVIALIFLQLKLLSALGLRPG